jgi:hypothetical protein
VQQSERVEHKSRVLVLDEVIIEGNAWPLVPDGEYVMRLLHHETVVAFRTPKVVLHLQIVELGPHHGKRLLRAYRVKELIGKRGRGGRFKLNRRHELFLTLARLYDTRLRHDRISLRALTKVLLRATTRTVTTDYQGRPLPACLHYSVVDQLVGIEAGAL